MVQLVSNPATPPPPSFLLVEQQFEDQDDRFVDSLRLVTDWKKLAGFAGRWKIDHRPWAHAQILLYLSLPLNRRGHQPVVKQLFKQAEATHQVDVLAVCLAAFDRLVRYQRKTRRTYDFETRQVLEEEVLQLPRNRAPLEPTMRVSDWRGRDREVAIPPNPRERLFTYKTRYYLRRRAWRYFRWLGFREPAAYVPSVCKALVCYQDADLEQGEDILESWGLMHICFGNSDKIQKSSAHLWLTPGATFADLPPAPAFIKLWRTESAFRHAWDLLSTAQSQLVRAWAIALIEAEHRDRLAKVDIDDFVRCLASEDEAVAEFGARWFSACPQLPALAVDRWLSLLKLRNPTAIETICRAMLQHVRADRLTFAQCVDVACAAPVPVARLGLDWLGQRGPQTDEDRMHLTRIGRAQCVALGRELATWALAQVGTTQCYLREHASVLLDSLNSGCREGAWEWLVAPESPGRDDPVLWSRLIESPHDDIQLPLLTVLNQRSSPRLKPKSGATTELRHRRFTTGLSAEQLTPVWSRILCHVHRGGRQKLLAIAQIKDAILQHRMEFETLLPILRVAIRSVRGPERAAGLTAVVEIATRRPELEGQLQAEFPELRLVGEEC